MSHADHADYCWRELPEYGARIEHPRLRQPISLIIDDPMPGYNPAYFHSGFRFGPARIPVSLVDEFADMIERTGIRGKFSIVPYPIGLGRVDRAIEGVSDVERRYFLDEIRDRIAPHMDITPEALTHWNALDLKTGQLLPYWEHVWSRSQTTETLIPYITLGLEILNNVDIPCRGVTSPWDFGDGVEDAYATAILEAQRAVYGRTFAWYFLQMDGSSPSVPPRLSVFDPAKGEAVVSVVTCDSNDFGAAVWGGGRPNPDALISADGQSGRLVETLRNGGSSAFHSHWQTMFSQGTYSGMNALELVAQRLETYFGPRIAWTGCDDLARYTATAAAVQLSAGSDSTGLRLSTPFACPRFTLSQAESHPVRDVHVDGKPLTRAASRAMFDQDSYLVENGRIYACWTLEGEQTLSVETA
ncbi:MAG: hypothetical protein JWO59_3525 [Chloroflexi bacterium]|nr:hypothetical protein [Chloroflexota bacterium]MDB5074027.1 hypothetical protein [Chloroflexota bacterium]